MYAETAEHLRNAVSETKEQHEKSLNSKAATGWQLTCKTRDEAHTRVLDKWDAQNEQWEALKQKQAIKFDKRPGDLAMERLDEHRKKVEIMQHLEMAAPIQEREGGRQWEWRMSLRNNWTRYVAIGNVFSELYYVRDELAFADPEHVRRPKNEAEDGVSYSTQSGRSVLNSAHLVSRRARLAKRVGKLLPGNLPEEDVEMLELVGQGLHDVAAREAARRISFEDLEEEIANASIETWAEIQKIKSDENLAKENAAAKRNADAERLEIERLKKLGPHCTLDAYRLSARVEVSPSNFVPSASLNGGVTSVASGTALGISTSVLTADSIKGSTTHVSTVVRNTGTTALYYQWTRDGTGLGPKQLPHSNKPPVSCTWFLTEMEGSLKPGESKKVQWTFKASVPGVYLDGWRLVTKPKLRTGPLNPIALRGVAFAEDPHSFPRRALDDELKRKEMFAKVSKVVRRVVNKVVTPERGERVATKPPRLGEWSTGGAPSSGPECAFFTAANVGRRPRVFFHPEVFETLCRICADAKALARLMPVEEGEEEEEDVPAEPVEPTLNENGEEIPPPASPSWGDWDGSVEAVESALDLLAKRCETNMEWKPTHVECVEVAEGEDTPGDTPPPLLASESLEMFRQHFNSAIEESLVPESRADLLAASMTEVLVTALDGVDKAARRARRMHEPRPVVPAEPAEGDDPPAEETPKPPELDADGNEIPPHPEPEPKWMKKYRKQLRDSVSVMLGEAMDSFEGPSEQGFQKAVTAVSLETERRAKELEQIAGRRRRALRFGSAFEEEKQSSRANSLKSLGEEDVGEDNGEGVGEDNASATSDHNSMHSSHSSSASMHSADGAAWEAFELRRRQRALTRQDPGEGAEDWEGEK